MSRYIEPWKVDRPPVDVPARAGKMVDAHHRRHPEEMRQMASQDSFGAKSTLDVDGTSYEIFRLDAVTGEGLDVDALPVQPQGAAGEPAAHRGRRRHHRRRHPGARRLGRRPPSPTRRSSSRPARVIMQDFTGVPVRRRPGHHARGDGRPRRRPDQDQPARAGRAGHRPLRDRRRLRHRPTRSSATSRSSTSATASATSSCAGARAPSTTSRSSRPAPASCTRSTSSTWPASCSPARSTASCRPTPTPASAPTRTPRWSTASAWSAGASAASRPRPRCSASRSRC